MDQAQLNGLTNFIWNIAAGVLRDLKPRAARQKLKDDFEQIPLLEEGGIETFVRREVLPYTPDAKIGYEISFTRHFYPPPPLRTLAEISADILELEQETEGLLSEITKGAAP